MRLSSRALPIERAVRRPALRGHALSRGFTLIELLVTMAIASVLIGVAVMLLSVMMRATSAQQARIERDRSLVQLADQFRRDVRAATSSKTPGPEGLVDFQLADESYRYRAAGAGIERLVLRGEKTIARDTFRLPSDSNVQINQTKVPAGKREVTFVSMLIKPNADVQNATPRHPFFVEAWLSGDHRFDRDMSESQP